MPPAAATTIVTNFSRVLLANKRYSVTDDGAGNGTQNGLAEMIICPAVVRGRIGIMMNSLIGDHGAE